jgi:GAF domain-containing protein
MSCRGSKKNFNPRRCFLCRFIALSCVLRTWERKKKLKNKLSFTPGISGRRKENASAGREQKNLCRYFYSKNRQKLKAKEVNKMVNEGTVQLIAEQLTENLNAERCTIRIPQQEKLKLIAAYGTESEKRQNEIGIEGTIAGEAFTTGKIVNVFDINSDHRYDSKYIDGPGQKSLLAIPLKSPEEEVLGVAQIYSSQIFSPKQVSLANTLAQFAALTLHHIEVSKMNRRAILDVVESIFEGISFKEIFKKAVEKISQRLEVPRCLIYSVFSKKDELWCQIAAGVPEGEHEIGLENPLPKHPDVEFAIKTKKIFAIDNPTTDERTKHFRTIIEKKKIRCILYVPLILAENVIGVIVWDACDQKYNFSAEEKSFCFDAGRIMARFIDHENARKQKSFARIADSLLNPNTSMGGYAKRLLDPLTKIYELTEECRVSSVCQTGAQIHQIAGELLPRAKRIESEAIRFDQVFLKIKEEQA